MSKQPIRVCVLLNNDFTRDIRVKREVETLVNAGYQVTVFAVESSDPDIPQKIDQGDLKIRRFIAARLDFYNTFNTRAIRAALKIISRGAGPYDVVHAHDCDTLFLAWILSKFWGAKLIYDSHEFWSSLLEERLIKLNKQKRNLKQFKKLLSFRIANLIAFKIEVGKNKRKTFKLARDLFMLELSIGFEKYLLAKSDAVITVCDSINSLLRDSVISSSEPIKRCITLRNICRYADVEKQSLIHQTFGLPPEVKIIIYQGWVKAIRGISQLLDTMELLDDKIALLIIGPAQPKYLEEIQERIQNSDNLRNRVFYQSPVYPEELLEWTVSADLGIHPILNCKQNHLYCLPNKVFEYIQAEVPLAVSDLPEISKIINNYNVGFTFNSDDPQDMAKKISQYFASPELTTKYKMSLKSAKKDLCWENEEKKLLTVYDDLLVDCKVPQTTLAQKMVN